VAHRHWADIRKILEQDLLCDSLKGRVRYFTTRYRKAHDDTGRVCVLVDENEIINMPFRIEDDRYCETYKRKNNMPDKSFSEIHKEVFRDFADKGLYYPGDFGFALDEFLSADIQSSLYSENWLVRMFAVLDRRVGKRTLEKIKSDIPNLPVWLQFFYNLRLESENI
jgi:hypothetical protein